MKTFSRLCLSVLLIVILQGCFSPPFEKPSRIKMTSFDPRTVRKNFKNKLPEAFEMQHTLKFRTRGRSFSSIGLTKIDLGNETFNAAALNPAGLKLFELSYENGDIDCKFVQKKLREKGDVCSRVAENIKNIFFARIPPPDSRIIKRKYILEFITGSESGSMKYIFKGSPPLLAEKRLVENGDLVWEAAYYEYKTLKGNIYPGGVVFTHHEYNYRLILNIKDIYR